MPVYVGWEVIERKMQDVHLQATRLQMSLEPFDARAISRHGLLHHDMLTKAADVRSVKHDLLLGNAELKLVHPAVPLLSVHSQNRSRYIGSAIVGFGANRPFDSGSASQ